MKGLFIIGMIVFMNNMHAMKCVGNEPFLSNVYESEDSKLSPNKLRLLNINALQIENDEDFSDTSSSTVETDKFLPLPNLSVNEILRKEVSPDVYGITSIKVDYAKLDRSFAGKPDAKNWKPPLIPFGGGSEVSENQSENVDDGNWLNFLF